MIQFIIPITPKAQARTTAGINKYTGRAQVFTPKAQRKNENDLIALMAPYAPEKPLEGPLKLSVQVGLPIPRSWSKKKQADALAGEKWPTVRPDLDNYIKQICDRMTTLKFWEDDSNVVIITATKVYTEKPCWQVSLEAALEGASK